MESEARLWLAVWLSLVVLILAALAMSLVFSAKVNDKIAEAIAHGADPIAARCAFNALGEQEAFMCAAVTINPRR